MLYIYHAANVIVYSMHRLEIKFYLILSYYMTYIRLLLCIIPYTCISYIIPVYTHLDYSVSSSSHLCRIYSHIGTDPGH